MTQNPNAAPEAVEHHLLTVSPDSAWRRVAGKALEGKGVSREIAPNANAAIERLKREERGDEKAITSVITDGLRGEWLRVAEAAIEAGAMPVLMTKSASPPKGAAEMGIPVFAKQRVEDSSQERLRLVKAAAPRHAQRG